jgi:hypothetical protein
MTRAANAVNLETWSAMDDRPQYWFGAKVGLGYRPPPSWRGWVAYAVWKTVWLAATPLINSQEHPWKGEP